MNAPEKSSQASPNHFINIAFLKNYFVLCGFGAFEVILCTSIRVSSFLKKGNENKKEKKGNKKSLVNGGKK